MITGDPRGFKRVWRVESVLLLVFYYLFCLEFGVFCETCLKPHKNNLLCVWMRQNIIYTYTKK